MQEVRQEYGQARSWQRDAAGCLLQRPNWQGLGQVEQERLGTTLWVLWRLLKINLVVE